MRFIIGAPILLVIAVLVTALCALTFVVCHIALPDPYRWLAPLLVGVLTAFGALMLWPRRRRRVSARARARFIHRVVQLSQVLLIAWLIYAIDAALGLAYARTSALHEILRTLCFAVCMLHLISSRWAELRFQQRALASWAPTTTH